MRGIIPSGTSLACVPDEYLTETLPQQLLAKSTLLTTQTGLPGD